MLLLNPDDRVEELLHEAERADDPEAAERLRQQAVVLMIDLADTVSRRYLGRGVAQDDLIQVGRLGLVKAVDGYRSGHGRSFAAYAVPTIAGEIKRYFRDHAWTVRPPRRLQELSSELASAEARLRQTLQGEPSSADVAHEVGIDADSVEEVRLGAAAYQSVSLDAPDPSGRTVGESLACPCRELDEVETRDALHQLLQQLNDREQLILRLRFVDERTQAQIGAVLGVSQMQVSRLLSSILARLRTGMQSATA